MADGWAADFADFNSSPSNPPPDVASQRPAAKTVARPQAEKAANAFSGSAPSSSSSSPAPATRREPTSSCSMGSAHGPVRSHKVVFLGEMGSGKTSLIYQYMYRTFSQSYQATVGMDFVSKMIHPAGHARAIKLQLWDTAGQERFRALISGYLRDSSACIVVYDITSASSFTSVRGWAEQATQDRGPREVILALVGNKLDLQANRAIPKEQGQALADEMGMLFYEASARTADGVDSIFDGLADALPAEVFRPPDKDEEIILEPPRSFKVDARRDKKKKICC